MKQSKKLATALAVLLMATPLAACREETVEEARHREFWTNGSFVTNGLFEKWSNELFRLLAESDPLNLRFLVKDYEAYGIKRQPASLFGAEIDYDAANNALTILANLPYEKLSRKNQITYRLLEAEYWSEEGEELAYTGSNFDYAFGAHANLFTILSEYAFYDKQDVEEYLNVIKEIPDFFDYLLEDEWTLVEEGYGLSDATLDIVIGQCQDVYSEEDCSLLSITSDKIQSLVSEKLLTPEEADRYTAAHEQYIAEYYMGTYRVLAEELEKMKGKGKNDGGLAGFGKAGKDYYAALLQDSLGYAGNMDDLFNGMQDYIDELMDESVSLIKKNYAAAVEWMNWMYDEPSKIVTPTDPKEVLSYFSTHLDEAFPSIGETTYNVKYLSESMEKVYPNTLAYYLIPPIDEYKNGEITVNGSICTGAQVLTTLAHEGYPGHLYQNVFFMNTNPLPIRRLLQYGGYSEGWGVYAECEALNYYEFNEANAVAADLTRVETVSSYIVQAALDIAVHYYGWDIDTIAEWMNSMGFNGDAAESVCSILIASPGLFLDYGAGVYEMYRLREYAESQKNFSLPEYHSLILEIGPCGFDLLEELVREYYEG